MATGEGIAKPSSCSSSKQVLPRAALNILLVRGLEHITIPCSTRQKTRRLWEGRGKREGKTADGKESRERWRRRRPRRRGCRGRKMKGGRVQRESESDGGSVSNARPRWRKKDGRSTRDQTREGEEGCEEVKSARLREKGGVYEKGLWVKGKAPCRPHEKR